MTQQTDVETHEVQAVLDALIGERGGEDALWWWTHLGGKHALLTAVASRVADERASLAREIYESLDEPSLANLSRVLTVSRARAQQLVERARGAGETQ